MPHFTGINATFHCHESPIIISYNRIWALRIMTYKEVWKRFKLLRLFLKENVFHPFVNVNEKLYREHILSFYMVSLKFSIFSSNDRSLPNLEKNFALKTVDLFVKTQFDEVKESDGR